MATPQFTRAGLWPTTGKAANAPVLVVWDVESCRVPEEPFDLDACKVYGYIWKALVELPNRAEAQVCCSCGEDTRHAITFMKYLRTNHNLSVFAAAKDGKPDAALQMEIHRFLHQNKDNKGTVVFITSTADFYTEMKIAVEVYRFNVEVIALDGYYGSEPVAEYARSMNLWTAGWRPFLASWYTAARPSKPPRLILFGSPAELAITVKPEDADLIDVKDAVQRILEQASCNLPTRLTVNEDAGPGTHVLSFESEVHVYEAVAALAGARVGSLELGAHPPDFLVGSQAAARPVVTVSGFPSNVTPDQAVEFMLCLLGLDPDFGKLHKLEKVTSALTQSGAALVEVSSGSVEGAVALATALHGHLYVPGRNWQLEAAVRDAKGHNINFIQEVEERLPPPPSMEIPMRSPRGTPPQSAHPSVVAPQTPPQLPAIHHPHHKVTDRALETRPPSPRRGSVLSMSGFREDVAPPQAANMIEVVLKRNNIQAQAYVVNMNALGAFTGSVDLMFDSFQEASLAFVQLNNVRVESLTLSAQHRNKELFDDVGENSSVYVGMSEHSGGATVLLNTISAVLQNLSPAHNYTWQHLVKCWSPRIWYVALRFETERTAIVVRDALHGMITEGGLVLSAAHSRAVLLGQPLRPASPRTPSPPPRTSSAKRPSSPTALRAPAPQRPAMSMRHLTTSPSLELDRENTKVQSQDDSHISDYSPKQISAKLHMKTNSQAALMYQKYMLGEFDSLIDKWRKKEVTVDFSTLELQRFIRFRGISKDDVGAAAQAFRALREDL